MIKRRKGCNDIVEEMLANENKEKSTVYIMHDDSSVSNYSEKLYPFLKKLYSLIGLNIDDEFDLKKLDEPIYNYFKEKMVQLSLDFGTDNIHKWIPSVATLEKFSLYRGKWIKELDGVLFLYRLNILLFEVASRQNPEIKDKSYYDRIRKVQEEYYNLFHQIYKKERQVIKKSKKIIESADSISMDSLENIEKEIEERKGRAEENETMTLIRRRDTILRTKISFYRRKNIKGCYDKEIKELKEKLEDSRGYIFIKDYFNEYLKLSLKNNEYQFPYELYGDREEIYCRCKDEYENNPEQDMDKLIHDITQSVYMENM